MDFKDGFENLPREEYPELYNTYSTYLYTERATTILEDYAVGNNAKPFFMYLATQSIHDPLEVPIEYEEMYPDSNIDSQLRKVKSKFLCSGKKVKTSRSAGRSTSPAPRRSGRWSRRRSSHRRTLTLRCTTRSFPPRTASCSFPGSTTATRRR